MFILKSLPAVLFTWIIELTSLTSGQEFGSSINDVRPLDNEARLMPNLGDMDEEISLLPEDLSHHKLVKRQVQSSPINMTFQLEKLGTWASQSTIKVGHKIPFKLTVWFDENGSTDLNIEVISQTLSDSTTNTEWAPLSLCTPSISSQGPNFGGFSSADIVPIMSANAGDGRHDRSAIDFGTVVGSNVGTNRDNDKMEILFDVTVHNHPGLNNGDSVWVSAGSQYNNQISVWIAQAVFTFEATTTQDQDSGIEPEFLLSGPDTLMKGDTGVWTLDMILRDATNKVLVEVYASYEGVQALSVCRVSVAHTGASYDCYSKEDSPVLSFPDIPNETPVNGTHTMALLDMSTVINNKFWDGDSTAADNNISLSISAMMLNSSDVVAGVTYKLGVAVEVDASSIWAAEIDVEASEGTFDSTNNLPSITTWTTEDQIIWNSIATMYINITIEEGLADVYSVEIALGDENSASIFTVGSEPVSVYYKGFNFPCWDGSNLVTTVENQDYLTMHLGLISNSGEKHTPSDNTVVLRVQVQVTPSSGSVADGDTVTFTTGVKIGSNLIWIGSLDFTYKDQMATTVNVAPTMTIWNMMNIRDSGILYEGGSTAYIIKLDFPAASFWPNLTINVNSPVVGDHPAIDICDCDVYQSGRDLVYGHENGSNTYGAEIKYQRFRVPKTKDFVTNSYNFILPNVGNAGYGNFWWASNDSALFIMLTIRTTNNPALVNESFYWLNITVDYDENSSPLTEDVALKYSTDQPELSESDAETSFSIVQTSGESGIIAAGVAAFDVNFVTTPRTMQDISVEAFTLNDSLSVCRVAMRKKGKNIPCLQDSESYFAYFGEAENVTCFENSTDSKCLTSQTDHSIYRMGKVPNIGQELLTNATSADSEFSVEVAVKFHENYKDVVSTGDSFQLILGVFQGGDSLYIDDVTVQADSGAIPISNIDPYMEWYKFENTSEIPRGGSAVFVLDMYIHPATMSTYRLEFFSPINSTQNGGKASICDARVMYSNWNLPCVNDSYLTHERLTLDNGMTYDAAVVDLGIINNVALDDGTYALDDPENMMRVEVTVCVPMDSEAVPGDYLWSAGTAKIDNNTIYVSSIPFQVVETIPETDSANDTLLAMQINESETFVVGIGKRKRFSLDITTEIVMTHLSFNFLFPDDSAGETLLTLINPHISFAGTNIACGENILPNVTISNTITMPSTSQDENLLVDLGIITNVGTTTRYRYKPYSPMDDVMTLSFDIVPADNAQNTDGSQKDFSVIMTDSQSRTDTINAHVVISRDGTETPELQIASISIPQHMAPTDINQGDLVTVSVHFNHTWESSAHAHNVVVRLFIPDLLHFVDYGGFDYTNPTFSYTEKRELSFTFPELFFSENDTFEANFTFDPTNTLPVGTGLVHLVIPSDITYSSESGVNYFTDVFLLEFDAYVPDCFEHLGMESGSIKSCQIVSSIKDGSDPNLVRLHSIGGWIVPGVRADPFLKNEYLQINFGEMNRITGFKIQPYADDTNFVSRLRLQYSYEGLKWFDYRDLETNEVKLFDLTAEVTDLASETEVLIKINNTYDHAIEARAIRIIPLESLNGSSQLAMRLELYGCSVPDSDTYNPCPVDNRKQAYERGYLLDESGGNLYVCMLSNIDDYIKCSYTEDQGESWEEISDQVININFMKRDTNALYGLERNRLSRVRSDDGGDNWWTVTELEYAEAEADTGNVIHVKSLPFNNWPLNLEDLYQEFGLYFNLTVKWTAHVDGLYVWTSSSGNWQMVSYWSDTSLN